MRLCPDAVIPRYAHEGDAGFDLVAAADVIIEPGETALIPTGIAVELPPGYELQVRPRSGITLRTKLRVQLGTVDSNYRGEIGVIVDNIATYVDLFDIPTVDDEYVVYGIDGKYHHSSESIDEGGAYIIRKGDKIAQGVIAPVAKATFNETDELSDTTRGTGGFGSSGVKLP
nr:deoxyuridine 5'-triphosphate nucleotidohydrolase [Caldifermentibacillus hisashii]